MAAYPWEAWEDEIIFELYGSRTYTSEKVLSALRGRRTLKAVKHRAAKLGVSRSDDWTVEEDQILKDLYPSTANTYEQIIDALDRKRSWSAVKHRAERLQICRGQVWQPEEERIIRELFENPLVSHQQIREALGNKTSWSKIARHAAVLGLTRTRSKNTLQEDYFQIIDTPEKAYLIGLIAADGCVYHEQGRYGVSFRMQTRDRIWLENLIAPIKRETRLVEYNTNGHSAVRVDIHSKKLALDLVSYGVDKYKTKSLRWPERLPDYLSMAFILGFFDGDGCLCLCNHRNGNYRSWSLLGTEQFLFTVKARIKLETQTTLRDPVRKDKNKCPHLYILQTRKQEYVL